MALSDEQLILRAVEGDESAFDALVSKYRARAYYLALSKLRDREAALDVAQEAFVQVYMSLRTLRDSAKFASWLSSIVANLCLMHLRKLREIAIPDDALDALHGAVESGYDLDAAVVRQAIDSLPNGTRSAAILYFIEEMKLSEIAEFLGISLAAVKSRVREARIRLQKEMIDVAKRTAKKSEPGDEFNENLRHKLELARWYRELADLFNSGVNIMCALDELRHGDYSHRIREATGELMNKIGNGSTMADALESLPALTTARTLGMVRAGEVGGILDYTVRFLADWIEIENSQREIELVFWCCTVGSVVAAGAPARMALERSIDALRSQELRKAAAAMIEAIDAGQPLVPVIEKHSTTFPPIVQVAILAGERSDLLAYALQWAANEVQSGLSFRFLGRGFAQPGRVAEWSSRFARAAADLVGDDRASIRAASATILGRLNALESADKMISLLADEDSEVRRSAVNALAEMSYADAQPGLRGRLSDQEPSVRRAAIAALVSLGRHESAPAIAELIGDEDMRVSHAAVTALENMGNVPVLAQWAIDKLDDEIPMNRGRAASILRSHPVPEAADKLLIALGDTSSGVTHTAALVLGSLGRTEAIPVLIQLLDHEHLYLVDAAAVELAKFDDPSISSHLRRAVERGRFDLRHHPGIAAKLKAK